MLRITLAQLNPTLGDIAANVARMREAAVQAQAQGAHLVVFPELSLTGYHPGELLADAAFVQRVRAGLRALLELTCELPDLYWVVGAPVGTDDGRARNCLLVVRNANVLLASDKQALARSAVVDETAYFIPGSGASHVLRIEDVRIGFLAGADLFVTGASDESSPLEKVLKAKPDLIVSADARPAALGAYEQHREALRDICVNRRIALMQVGQVGGHDDWVYEGGSRAIAAGGSVFFEAKRFEEGTTTLAFDAAAHQFAPVAGQPLSAALQDLSKVEFYRRLLVLGLRDYARRCGLTKVVVGASGGIDSALVLALAVEALGAQNVAALAMPSQFSSVGSVQDAQALCANLGIPLQTYPIQGMVDAFVTGVAAHGQHLQLEGLALENLQARVRGTLLMAYSNTRGHLVLATGNKSEASVGYCTLYGDTNGGLAPIADVYKTEVFELCEHLNERAGYDLIPRAILEKPPSAELAPGQKDTDSLPPYEVLDDVLRSLIEGDRLEGEEAERVAHRMANLQATDEGAMLVQRVRELMARSQYKRRQSPPILRVRPAAHGARNPLPIAAVR
jgi:NAD+ synthetase